MTDYIGASHLRAAVCLGALVVADPGLGVVVVPVTVGVRALAERLLDCYYTVNNGPVCRAASGTLGYWRFGYLRSENSPVSYNLKA